MFAGHGGAALALGRASLRINPGILIFAALALDLILWILVLAGLERVDVPPRKSRVVGAWSGHHVVGVALLGVPAQSSGCRGRRRRVLALDSGRSGSCSLSRGAATGLSVLVALVSVLIVER